MKITHVMADGTIRESMKGVVIPLTPRTRRAYEIMAKVYREQQQKEKKSEKIS